MAHLSNLLPKKIYGGEEKGMLPDKIEKKRKKAKKIVVLSCISKKSVLY